MEDWLTAAARRRPGHPAVVADDGQLTYRQLDDEASRVARRLAALGVGEGGRVATTLPAGAAFAALLHAAPRVGAALAVLRPGLEAPGDSVLVAEPLEGVEADVALRTQLDPDAPHTVIHTSGTTGEPHAVELTAANHHASALASARRLGAEPGDRWLCVLPVFHVGGLAILLRSAIHATTAVVHAQFEAGRVRAALETGDVTVASFVPTMLHRLRAAGLGDAPALRLALLGGGPIPAALLDWARERGLPVAPTYGMTETASQIATVAPGDALRGERRALPLDGVELRIGSGGEIEVRGPMVAPGERDADGWLRTGDVGTLDERGRLTVSGRLKDLIVSGGENVMPGRVEEALREHPAVADAAVAGVPDAEWGERVVAWVILDGEAATGHLIAHCRSRLAPFEVPKEVHPVAELPRSATGKLVRSRLARPTTADG